MLGRKAGKDGAASGGWRGGRRGEWGCSGSKRDAQGNRVKERGTARRNAAG